MVLSPPRLIYTPFPGSYTKKNMLSSWQHHSFPFWYCGFHFFFFFRNRLYAAPLHLYRVSILYYIIELVFYHTTWLYHRKWVKKHAKYFTFNLILLSQLCIIFRNPYYIFYRFIFFSFIDAGPTNRKQNKTHVEDYNSIIMNQLRLGWIRPGYSQPKDKIYYRGKCKIIELRLI